MIEIILGILGFIFLYFVSGFSFINLIFPKKNILDKIILSIGFSILLNVIFGYFLASLNSLKFDLLLIMNLFFSIIMFLLIKLKNIKLDFKLNKKELKTLGILILISVFIFFLIFKVHFAYTGLYQDPYTAESYKQAENMKIDLPIHGDEWTHLAQSIYIIDSRGIGFTNPYIKGFPSRLDLESGFHLFTAEHFILLKSDPVLSYKFLPALFAIITALFIFLFMRKITNENIAFLSMLFFATLKSNINLLGTWFFTPLTMSFFILFLYFYFFVDKKKNLTKNILLITIVLLSAFIYPLLTIIIVGTSLVYIVLNHKDLEKFWFMIPIGLIIGFFIIKSLFPQLIFSQYWTPLTMGYFHYNLIFLIGIINSILAFAGVYFLFKKNINWIVLIIPFATLINFLIFYFFKVSLLIPYERNIYYFMLGIIPLSAIGLYNSLIMMKNRFSINKDIKKIIITVALIIVLTIPLLNYYDITKQNIASEDSKNLVLMIPISNNGYKVIKYLFDNYGGGKLVLANSLLSYGIYPISQNHVFAIQPSTLGAENKLLYPVFLKQSCKNRIEFLQYYKINFIISETKFDCEYLNLIKTFNNYNIYEFELI